jgi:MtN3 and saliva related transmembrane protein
MAAATEAIGWASACILLATISRQVWTQWRTRSVAGVSRWLFVGQLAASTGFLAYSVLLANWVFVATNLLMVAAALTGAWVDRVNRHRAEHGAVPGAVPVRGA